MTGNTTDNIEKALAPGHSNAMSNVEGHMRYDEFAIGETFWCSGHKWRCTDIGSRVITAIKLDHEDDPTWYNGPPYAVAEVVFDEYDIEGCTHEPDLDDTASPAAGAGAAD